MKKSKKIFILLLVTLGSFVCLLMQPASMYQQNTFGYIDQRSFLGVPNFLDIISNLPFLVVGSMGLHFQFRNKATEIANLSWIVLFFGVLLVSIGSSYYHWSPSAETLVWDRLPMTFGFMGLFSATLTEFVDHRSQKYLLLPLLFLGVLSVIYWYMANDIRPYIWVQFFPLLLLVIILTLFRPVYSHSYLYLLALCFYILAKISEHWDAQVYEHTGAVISGHSAKHLLAAASLFFLVHMLKKRKLKITNKN